ncbi:hypothetical protein VULLAG_LOCUS13509 [Vulpes lagopus]
MAWPFPRPWVSYFSRPQAKRIIPDMYEFGPETYSETECAQNVYVGRKHVKHEEGSGIVQRKRQSWRAGPTVSFTPLGRSEACNGLSCLASASVTAPVSPRGTELG